MARYRASQVAERTRPRHYLEYGLLRVILFLVSWLPFPAAMWLARRLGELAFDVLRIRRRVTLENLRCSLPGPLDERTLARIARRAYRNFGMCFVEFALFGHHSLERLGTRMRFRNRDHIDEAAASGRGVIYLTAHTGNWELLGVCLALVDRPISVVVGDQRNLFVDRLTKELRAGRGEHLIPIGSALREVLKTLRAGGRLGLLADQDGGRDGIFIDFFGRPASTPVGPARFAYRTGALILVALDRYVAPGMHEVVVHPPIAADPERPEEEEIRRILVEYNRALETFVREYPDSWFWMHRRWKTRPDARTMRRSEESR